MPFFPKKSIHNFFQKKIVICCENLEFLIWFETFSTNLTPSVIDDSHAILGVNVLRKRRKKGMYRTPVSGCDSAATATAAAAETAAAALGQIAGLFEISWKLKKIWNHAELVQKSVALFMSFKDYLLSCLIMFFNYYLIFYQQMLEFIIQYLSHNTFIFLICLKHISH